MKYKALSTEEAFDKSNGTSLVGHVRTTYDVLRRLFGEPFRDGDKTSKEWIIEFEDESIATIYDYKDIAPEDRPYGWHVGGHGKGVLDKVKDLIRNANETKFQEDNK